MNGRCSLCSRKFKTEADFRKHAASFHAKRVADAAFVPQERRAEREPESEWEFYHQSRGWPS